VNLNQRSLIYNIPSQKANNGPTDIYNNPNRYEKEITRINFTFLNRYQKIIAVCRLFRYRFPLFYRFGSQIGIFTRDSLKYWEILKGEKYVGAEVSD
jgi:hypothetical protein